MLFTLGIYTLKGYQEIYCVPVWKKLTGCSSQVRSLHSTSVHSNPPHFERSKAGISEKEKLKKCYLLLGLHTDCTLQDLRDTFLKLARTYHPDSGHPTANAEKFADIESAYRTLREHISGSKEDDTAQILEKDFGIKHTVPQHRQYLGFEGVGYGTPSQRLKQYQQHKVAKAVESVNEYQIKKETGKYERTLIKKDATLARQYKTTQALERLVEDMISESVARGEFDNLPGSGKPLKYTPENPYVDRTTHRLNQVLINNGFVPEWVSLEKEIRYDRERIRRTLVHERSYFSSKPLTPSEQSAWDSITAKMEEVVKQLNKKIDKFNMIVPTITKQQLHFQLKKEAQRVIENAPEAVCRKQDQSDKTVQNEHQETSGFLSLFFRLMK